MRLSDTHVIVLCALIIMNGALMVPGFVDALGRFTLILGWLGMIYLAGTLVHIIHPEFWFWLIWYKFSSAVKSN